MNDDYTPEPEPDAEPPLDLEEVQELMAQRHGDLVDAQREAERRLLDEVLPDLLAELGELRAYVEGLRRARIIQYVITSGPEPELGTTEMATVEQVERAATRPELGKTVWGRDLYAQPWMALSNEPPF